MNRRALPNRRPAVSLQFAHGRIDYHGSASFDENLNTIEIFLDAGKPGSEVQAMARDCAVIASLALQHGTPLAIMRKAVTRLDDGSAAGPMGRLLDLLEVRSYG